MNYLQRSAAQYEKGVEALLTQQITDPESPDFGGIYNIGFGLVPPNCGGTAGGLISLYFCPESKYYRDARVLRCA
ncbi:MAG: hypothetical protein RSF73_10215, partial [Ruthenibacterium sp.]